MIIKNKREMNYKFTSLTIFTIMFCAFSMDTFGWQCNATHIILTQSNRSHCIKQRLIPEITISHKQHNTEFVNSQTPEQLAASFAVNNDNIKLVVVYLIDKGNVYKAAHIMYGNDYNEYGYDEFYYNMYEQQQAVNYNYG